MNQGLAALLHLQIYTIILLKMPNFDNSKCFSNPKQTEFCCDKLDK